MSEIIDKALKIVSKVARKYKAARDIYYVMMGTNRDRMHEHPSGDNYCQDCINEAVDDKKRQFFLNRRDEMGKIYEYQQCGFYREPQYTFGEDGNANGLVIKKVKAKEPKEKVLQYLQRQLRKKYPVKMIFDYRYYNCGETDDFDLCEGCGVIFDQGLLLSDQEMEHWESLTKSELKGCISNPGDAFMLSKILYDYTDKHKYANRIMSLAKRIIAIKPLHP